MIDSHPMPLAAVQEQMSACIKCAACMPVCPTYREARRESLGPRGRLTLAVGLLSGQLNADDGADGPISSCIDCRACVPACPRNIPLAGIFYAAKAQLMALGAGGWRAKVLQKLAHWAITGNRFTLLTTVGRWAVALYHGITDASPVARLLPFFRNGRKRALPEVIRRPFTDEYPEIIPAQGAPTGRVVFFPGCVINFTSTDIGRATISALTKLGVEVVLPKAAPCCGIPLLSLGDRDGAKQVAQSVVARYGAIEADAIVTACASCGTTLRDSYPNLLENAPAAQVFADRVMDITEYITQNTDYQNHVQPLKQQRVTYHDPCHLVRGMGVTEAPRQILATLSGEDFTEMDGADQCCGFGGLFSALHYDLALQVGAGKAQSVAASGATRVATGCPGCQMQMTDSLGRAGVNATVQHTVELLDNALPKPKIVSN